MTELARKILDELLGPDRNKPASQRGTGGVKFYDSNVCRLYLVDFCPYETFLNTKSDLGMYIMHYFIIILQVAAPNDTTRNPFVIAFNRPREIPIEKNLSANSTKQPRSLSATLSGAYVGAVIVWIHPILHVTI